MTTRRQFKAFVITAFSTEYLAVREHLTDISEERHQAGSLYERGLFRGENSEWDVWVIEAGKGNERAAMEVERGLQTISPDVSVFCGVAGGIKDVGLGDVVFADKVYGYESGKALQEFRPRPDLFRSSDALLHRCRAEVRSKKWVSRLADEPDEVPGVFEGPIAAGEKIVASRRAEVARYLKQYYGDALAVEMEGHGAMLSAHSNQTPALVIRGISDLLAGKFQSDSEGWQERAMVNAAAFLFGVLARFEPPVRPHDDAGIISWEMIQRTLTTMHREIETIYAPDLVLTMSGPGSIAAAYTMSLNTRDVPIVFATTFPIRDVSSKPYKKFLEAAKPADWPHFETAKWSVYLPNVLKYLPKKSKILIFDDRVLSGETQTKASEILRGWGYTVECAAMLCGDPVPDFVKFCGRVVTDDYYMPWGTKRGRT